MGRRFAGAAPGVALLNPSQMVLSPCPCLRGVNESGASLYGSSDISF
jgi:hypothetical protein